jgi:hypothetical protein
MAEDVVLVEGEAVAQLEIGGDARASGDCVMPARLIKAHITCQGSLLVRTVSAPGGA